MVGLGVFVASVPARSPERAAFGSRGNSMKPRAVPTSTVPEASLTATEVTAVRVPHTPKTSTSPVMAADPTQSLPGLGTPVVRVPVQAPPATIRPCSGCIVAATPRASD